VRLCRYAFDGHPHVAFYRDDTLVPLIPAAALMRVNLPESPRITDYLPGGPYRRALKQLEAKLATAKADALEIVSSPMERVKLLVPVPSPSKLLLLAGNYTKHIEEGGGKAEERAKTFPYVFMKPAATTLTHPGDPIRIPAISPDEIDWELELGVVIGRECRRVKEVDALNHVAGYTIVNDVSDRAFHPNPGRSARTRDGFFDWLHGKWHDTFCPLGPCILPADEVPDPQRLRMTLRVNGEVEQDASTAEMVFPVAAVIEFVSSFVTLQPGDIISTGTPEGTGKAKGKFLKAGDVLEGEIEGIGVLRNPVVGP
jgi:2-keto-4-pentenoate hydratase/2-oxohepta-3-ene-1,7-dioic acid hydratase in catechol pathway